MQADAVAFGGFGVKFKAVWFCERKILSLSFISQSFLFLFLLSECPFGVKFKAV